MAAILKAKYWFLVFLWMLLIFTFSSMPGTDIPYAFGFQDTFFHIFMFCVLAIFFYRAMRKSFPAMPRKKIVIFTIVFGFIYGISDELHQLFVPLRVSSASDVLLDGLGSFIGSLLNRDKN